MLEIAILTCLEANLIIGNIQKSTLITEVVREELIETVLQRSECRNEPV